MTFFQSYTPEITTTVKHENHRIELKYGRLWKDESHKVR